METQKKLSFELINDMKGRFIQRSPELQVMQDSLNAIAYTSDINYVNTFEYKLKVINIATSIMEQYPYILDAYATCGHMMLSNHQEEEASNVFDAGLMRAMEMIPPSFDGEINYDYVDNRAFLHTHYGKILCLCKYLELDKSIEECIKHLKWNPKDELGVRHVLSGLYTFKGDRENVNKLMGKYLSQPTHPGYLYNIAYLHFTENSFSDAIHNLRMAILMNPYIAEILLGNENPLQRPMDIGMEHSNKKAAAVYCNGFAGEAWRNNVDALAFLNWLIHSSTCLLDRARWASLHEALHRCTDNAQRVALMKQNIEIKKSINIQTSSAMDIVLKTKDGRHYYAWDTSQYRDGSD